MSASDRNSGLHLSWPLSVSAIQRASPPSRSPQTTRSLSRIFNRKYMLPLISFLHVSSVSSISKNHKCCTSLMLAQCSPAKVKSGYPPRALTLVPELPVQSLGLLKGDQLIVNESTDLGSSAAAAPQRVQPLAQSARSNVQPRPSAAPPVSASAQAPTTRSQPSPGPDHLELDGGFLIHRVSALHRPLRNSRRPYTCNTRSFPTTTRVFSPPSRWCLSKALQKLPNCVKVWYLALSDSNSKVC